MSEDFKETYFSKEKPLDDQTHTKFIYGDPKKPQNEVKIAQDKIQK